MKPAHGLTLPLLAAKYFDGAAWRYLSRREVGFAVSLSGSGTQTQGVVLCNQPRVIDLQASGGRFIERIPRFIIDEVLAKLATVDRLTMMLAKCRAAGGENLYNALTPFIPKEQQLRHLIKRTFGFICAVAS